MPLCSLSSLKIWQDNYNHNDIHAIARSIQRFGFNTAPRVWRDGIIMAGNHSYLALCHLRDSGQAPPANVTLAVDSEWQIATVDVSHLDEREARAFAIADNNLARQATSDDALLAKYLQELHDADPSALAATGYSENEYTRLINRVFEEMQREQHASDAPADEGDLLREKWGTAPGQLWRIPSQAWAGDHRLLCGDSTNEADVQRLMDGRRAVLFATDPPYAVDYDGNNHPDAWGDEDKNKDWSENYSDWDKDVDAEALYSTFVACAIQHAITPDAAWYCWHASRHQAMLERVWQAAGAFLHQTIIWSKNRATLTRSHYMWAHEPCFFGWLKGHRPRRASDDFLTTVWQADVPLPGTRTLHTTSKPIELFAIPMRQHTAPGDLCYEPFAGSGSQFVAAEQQGRLVYGIEREPVFVAVILERLAGMGLSPELLP